MEYDIDINKLLNETYQQIIWEEIFYGCTYNGNIPTGASREKILKIFKAAYDKGLKDGKSQKYLEYLEYLEYEEVTNLNFQPSIKKLHAARCTLGDYYALKNIPMPKDENPNIQGYVMIYDRGTPDEGMTWLPTRIFENKTIKK